MEVVLHPGVHRTGSTSFQRYMRDTHDARSAHQIAFWGPLRTRRGLFHGVAEGQAPKGRRERPPGRVLMNTRKLARQGAETLIVSDENMLGTPLDNIRRGTLYAAAGERMARFHAAFGGKVVRVVLAIRSPELYWASLYAHALTRGARLPAAAELSALAWARRGWREVIEDMACALPGAQIRVVPFECFAGHPEALARIAAGRDVPPAPRPYWANRSPCLAQLRTTLADRGEDPARLPPGEGRWQPFADPEIVRMRESYADDLYWLKAGAGGLAKLIEDPDDGQTRFTWQARPKTRGHSIYDRQTRDMALARRR